MSLFRRPGASSSDSARHAGPRAVRSAFAEADARTRDIERQRLGRPMPSVMLLGEGGGAPLLRALSRPARAIEPVTAGGLWTWNFGQGIVLHVGDRCLPVGEVDADLTPWRTLVRLLGRARPFRGPAALVLAIPATQLHGPEESGPERATAAAAKGEWVAERIRELVREIGRALPLYVVVTDCDAMPGFQEFVGAWPARHRREMLGWSNPHPVDAPFQAGWLEEAWSALAADLDRAQRAMLVGEYRWESDEGLFRWPGEVPALAEPLAAYLTPLLAGTAEPSLFLRGLYLCGRLAGTPDAAPAGTSRQLSGLAAQRAAAERIPVFVRDLFEAKVFAETGLARRLPRVVRRQAALRRVLHTAVAAAGLALVLGLTAATLSLHSNAASLRTVLREGRAHLTDIAERNPTFLRDAARRVMARVSERRASDAGPLTSAFLPSSWLASLHDELIDAMRIIHERILLQAVAVALDEKLVRIIASPRPVDTPAAAQPVHLEQRPEYRELASLLAELTEVERQAAAYRRIGQTGTLHPLGRLMRAADVPVQLAAHRAAVTERVRQLLEALQSVTLEAERLPDELTVLAQQLDALAAAPPEGGRARSLDALATSLTAVQRRLARPDMVWLEGDRFDLGPAFQRDIETPIRQSALLNRDLLPAWQAAGDAALAALQLGIARVQSAEFGPVLARNDSRLRLRLAPDVAAVGAVLAELYAQPFMAVSPTPALAVAPRSDTVWDLAALLEIIRLYDQYVVFRSTGLPQLAPAVQAAVHQAVVERLADQMQSRLSHAARHAAPLPAAMDEPALREAVDQFERTAAALGRIETQFTELRLTGPARALAVHVATQAVLMLTAVERRAAEEALYRGRPACVAGGRPSLAAFGAQDGAGLLALLTRQRDRIADLARTYAQPLLHAINRRPDVRAQVTMRRPEAQIVLRWEGILADLDRYDRREPGNGVAALERFILVEMDRVTLRNFSEKLDGDVSAPVGRYFIEKLNALRRDMRARCAAQART